MKYDRKRSTTWLAGISVLQNNPINPNMKQMRSVLGNQSKYRLWIGRANKQDPPGFESAMETFNCKVWRVQMFNDIVAHYEVYASRSKIVSLNISENLYRRVLIISKLILVYVNNRYARGIQRVQRQHR